MAARRPLTDFLGPRYWPTWVGLGLLRLICLLPLPVIAIIGQGLGEIFYWITPSRRRIAFKNVSVCFPEKTAKECWWITRRNFHYTGQAIFSTPKNWWMSKKSFNNSIELIGREHYDNALAQGRNIILLSPHFVSIEVAGLRLAQERTMYTMYQYAKNALVDEIVIRGRTRFGGDVIERKAPLRTLIRAIKSGDPFVYLPDQDAGRKGIFVPFFHELASTVPMLAKFAAVGDAVVIPVGIRTKAWGQGYAVTVLPALENYPSGDDVVDTTRMNQAVEELIRPYPEQYFWVHKRFKTRPPAEIDLGTKFYE